jgi:hypothetical protein
MATVAKISLTCKLNQVPKHRELPDRRIEFFLQDGKSDRIFTVQMKSKIVQDVQEADRPRLYRLGGRHHG